MRRRRSVSINSHKMRMGKHEHTWWTVKIRSAPVPAGHKRELKVASVTRRSTNLWIINLMFLASLGCVAGCLSMEVKRMGDSEGKILYRKEALAGKGGVEELTTLDQRLIFPPWLAMDMYTQNEGSTKNPRQRDHRRAQSPERTCCRPQKLCLL